MLSQKRKTILVTGASSGFGQQIARILSEAGHTVFGTSRRPQGDLGSAEHPVRMLALDVTDATSVGKCIKQLLTEASSLDVLINNAGNGLAGAIEDCADDEVAWQMDTNFSGPLRMIRQVLPIMRQQGHGRIITIGSVGGHISVPYQGIYCASKHALEAVNEALRLELRGSGVDATIICPGDFKTGFTAARRFARNAESVNHAKQMKTTVSIYERDEQNGANPVILARLVTKLVNARSLRVRYLVGRFDQRLGVYLKQWLPASLFEAVLRRIYKLP